MSQAEVAEKANISLRNLQRIENGLFLPKIETLNTLAEALQVPVYYLLDSSSAQADLPQLELAADHPHIVFLKSLVNENSKQSEFIKALKSGNIKKYLSDDFYNNKVFLIEIYYGLIILNKAFADFLNVSDTVVPFDSFYQNNSAAKVWFFYFKNKMRYTQTERVFTFPQATHLLRITGLNFVDDPNDLRRLALIEPIEQNIQKTSC